MPLFIDIRDSDFSFCFRFVLRNYIAQNAINAAEKGDFSEVRNVLSLLQNPFSDIILLKKAEASKPSTSSLGKL